MVTVYQWSVWDPDADEMKVQPHKATSEWIAKVRGDAIDGTAEDVPEGAIDSDGRYKPQNASAGVQGTAAYGVAGGYGVSGAYASGALGRASVGRNSSPAAENDAVRINAEHRRRQTAAISAATSGQTEPLSPLPAGNVLMPQPAEAGSAPSFVSSSVVNNPAPPGLPPTAAAIIQERPADIEAMARNLAGEFDRERERARSTKSNAKPEDADAYCDFLEKMSARLNELAGAIHVAFLKPQPGEPIFTPKVQEVLEAVGADFFDFLKTNKEKVYTIGLYAAAAAFLSALGAPAAGGFLSGLLLGKSTAPTPKK